MVRQVLVDTQEQVVQVVHQASLVTQEQVAHLVPQDKQVSPVHLFTHKEHLAQHGTFLTT